MTNEEASSLTGCVEQFITDLRNLNAQPISAPFVAESILDSFPHRSLFTVIEATAAYMGIAQVARQALRGQHDREYDANRVGQISLNLPESALLNGGYSVIREREPVYVPRLTMSREDMEYVCGRFDALSQHFARHSRALRADWERRNTLVPA